MTWVKDSLYLPEGMDPHTEYPLLVISQHRNWDLIHDEIQNEAPDYPVMLIIPGGMVYGMRFRAYEFWYMAWDDYTTTQFAMIREWEEQVVACRVTP